jgi:beta-aspartyl-dipeptidase (metallo-type)
MNIAPGSTPILVSNVEAYAPERIGRTSILLFGGKMVVVDPALDPGRVFELARSLGLEIETIDGSGLRAIPGLVDPHEHLSGGSGEDGFSTQTPAVSLSELIAGGITTVVGCVGVDTHCQNLPNLFGKAKALREEGITAFLYTGGYDVPPRTLTGDVRTDLIFVEEVIGAGETAISDFRSTQPTDVELARLVAAARTGGLLTRKAGVTHFHLGDEKRGLAPLRRLLDEHDIAPECLYPTHVERKPALLREAAELTRRGVTVDIDTYEEALAADLRAFVGAGGDLGFLTLSSDASIKAPRTLFEQVRACIRSGVFPPETLLSLVTTNPARVLKLGAKGRIAKGADADLLLVDDGWEIRTVIASGRILMRDRKIIVRPRYFRDSNRFDRADLDAGFRLRV